MLQIRAALLYYKLGQTLLQIGAASLLQIGASVVTHWDSYYKLGQLLQKFRKKWCALYSCYLRFKIRPFAILPTSLKNRDKLTPNLRFCYFSEVIFSLKSYYQFYYVSVWLTGVLFTIANILIKS